MLLLLLQWWELRNPYDVQNLYPSVPSSAHLLSVSYRVVMTILRNAVDRWVMLYNGGTNIDLLFGRGSYRPLNNTVRGSLIGLSQEQAKYSVVRNAMTCINLAGNKFYEKNASNMLYLLSNFLNTFMCLL